MASELKKQVVKGSAWALLERFSNQIILFVVSMVLARLLTPADYGTVALLSLFIVVATVLVDSGLGLALIQKKEASELDFNSIFYISLFFSAILYLILFFSAPYIADFYKEELLVPILRIEALTLFFSSLNTVQNAEIARNLLFNLSFKVSLVASIVSAVVGISLAYLGYGVWALVWSQVLSGFVSTISKWFIVKWRPKMLFSFSALKPLYEFGWKMLLVNLLDVVYRNTYGLLIGKFYTKDELSFVNKGQNQPNLVMNSIEGALARVALPTLSKFQEDKDRMIATMRKVIVMSSFFVFPLMTILACTAYGQIRLMYGEQWLPCVPYVQLACFQMALYPFHNMNLQAIAALGRTDLSLKLELIKKAFSFTVVFISVQFSVWTLMVSLAFIVGPFSVLVNSWPNKKLFGYSLSQQIRDVSPSLGVCVIIGIVMTLISYLDLNYIIIFFLQGFSGVILYLLISIYFKTRGIREVLSIGGREFISRFPLPIRSYVVNVFDYLKIG